MPAPTLKSYPENVAVSITVPFLDFNGDAVVPTAVNYRVTDEAGTELVPLTAAPGFVSGATSATITVPANQNVLLSVLPPPPPGTYDERKLPTRGIRVVEVQMTVAGGSILEITERYIVTKNLLTQLQLVVNSFQTYDQALLERANMPKLVGWDIASDNDRISALQEAYFRITRLGYRVKHPSFLDSPPAGGRDFWPDDLIPPRYWPVMTPDRFMRYQQSFRTGLYRAQIAEADVILNGDKIAARRRDGLLSESIGESHMMFRTGKPLDLPISRQAIAYLHGFIDWRYSTTRL